MVERNIFSLHGIKVNRDKPWNTAVIINKIGKKDSTTVMIKLGEMSRALSGVNGSIPEEGQDVMIKSVHEEEVGVD